MNIKLSEKQFMDYLKTFDNQNQMKQIIQDVHTNKKYTSLSITKIFLSQYISKIWTTLKNVFTLQYKAIIELFTFILSVTLAPILFPLLLIYKIISSKNHYKAGLKHFDIKDIE